MIPNAITSEIPADIMAREIFRPLVNAVARYDPTWIMIGLPEGMSHEEKTIELAGRPFPGGLKDDQTSDFLADFHRPVDLVKAAQREAEKELQIPDILAPCKHAWTAVREMWISFLTPVVRFMKQYGQYQPACILDPRALKSPTVSALLATLDT